MATKHEQILQYIENLPVGSKISVRQIARELDVSDGTAYRAIKDAENQGFVSTIERVGTIRIEKKKKENIEKLTFAEVVNIVDGQVLGGRKGLHKSLNKFVIGAMKLEAMMRYVDAGNLLIVGNRDRAHVYGLRAGAAVLITGGFSTSDEAIQLADRLALPVISTSYDTFTVAAMINRAIYDRLIKKEIALVGDILIPAERTEVVFVNETVARWYELNEKTGHSRYPVVDRQMKVQGMVTAKDVIDRPRSLLIQKVMTKNPITVQRTTSVASAAHTMVWEGIELLPVTDAYHRLEGIITRQDVLKALQMIQRQPQIGETIDDLITHHVTDVSEGREMIFRCEVTPQMTNYLGTVSYGAAATLAIEAGRRLLQKHNRGELVVENLTFYFLRPVQIENVIEMKPRILKVTRRYGKVEVEAYHEEQLVSQAMFTAQFIDRN